MKDPTQPILKVEGLSKRYGSLEAVKDLSFSICPGEIFGLLGPNGAGKTTTLECILGTRKTNGGTITILNKEKPDRSLFEQIGIQFQDSRYPDLIKVKELCRMTASLYRKKTDWLDLLAFFQLKDKKEERVADLSGGEKQKLSILLALINDPVFVFLDELTTGLDPRARREVWGYLQKLKEKGLSILLTSHFMDEVHFLCDRILIMDKGEEIISGTPQGVIDQSGQGSMEEAYLYYTGLKGEKNEKNIIRII